MQHAQRAPIATAAAAARRQRCSAVTAAQGSQRPTQAAVGASAPLLQASAHAQRTRSHTGSGRSAVPAQRAQRCPRLVVVAAKGFKPAPAAEAADPKGDDAPVPVQVYDQLIQAFRERTRDEWRKLLAVSREWPKLSTGVYARILELAEAAEPDEALQLQRLHRTLGETDAEINGYANTFEEFLSTSEEEWEALVGVRRAALPATFFEYLQMRISSLDEEEHKQAREDLARAAARLLALVDAHDTSVQSEAQLEESFKTFQDLVQVGSFAEMDTKLDDLVKDGKLTPALMLTTAKMYMSVKESPYIEEDVKDVLVHLYTRMKTYTASQQPVEVRILKHVLTFEDPVERRSVLGEAFTPGAPLETEKEDYLCTTPDNLLLVVDSVLAAYDAQRGQTVSLTGEAASLMTPAVIERMRAVRKEIARHFM